MKIQIVEKKTGTRRASDDTQAVILDRPSVVFLKLAPENVARYERRGDDLILILKDGKEVAIRGFFVKHGEADTDRADQLAENGDQSQTDRTSEDERMDRSDLVLEDDHGVMWWGQYPESWSEFHFTEIEWDEAGAVIWPWLLGALGAAGLGALVIGGKKAHPPVATDDSARGDEDGGPVTGNVLGNDRDPDDDKLTVTK